MSWSRVLLGGLAGGIALLIADFVMHGLIMGPTYMEYPDVFTQEDSGIGSFALVSILLGLAAAFLFAKTRSAWPPGLVGGAFFGLALGATQFIPNFYDALVYEGFPSYLAWCHGGMDLIAITLAAIVAAIFIK